jgi:hypothetical protein
MPLFNKIFEHIKHHASATQPVDTAIVLDTTSSMADDIGEIKKNLAAFLTTLKTQKEVVFRFAILEFKDQDDFFVHRVRTDFTPDIDQVIESLQQVHVNVGGDPPEATLDALLAAQSKLTWNKEAVRAAILISDAPPHPWTLDGRHDMKFVTRQYQAAGINIQVYPIITNNS